MNKSRFSEEYITFALKQAWLGTSMHDVCRKLGISDGTVILPFLTEVLSRIRLCVEYVALA